MKLLELELDEVTLRSVELLELDFDDPDELESELTVRELLLDELCDESLELLVDRSAVLELELDDVLTVDELDSDVVESDELDVSDARVELLELDDVIDAMVLSELLLLLDDENELDDVD